MESFPPQSNLATHIVAYSLAAKTFSFDSKIHNNVIIPSYYNCLHSLQNVTSCHGECTLKYSCKGLTYGQNYPHKVITKIFSVSFG